VNSSITLVSSWGVGKIKQTTKIVITNLKKEKLKSIISFTQISIKMMVYGAEFTPHQSELMPEGALT